jgi:hypothetical protein
MALLIVSGTGQGRLLLVVHGEGERDGGGEGEPTNREFIPCLSLFDATRLTKNAETTDYLFSPF